MTATCAYSHDGRGTVFGILWAFRTGKLKPKINQDKSVVDRPGNGTFLGYLMMLHNSPRLKALRSCAAGGIT